MSFYWKLRINHARILSSWIQTKVFILHLKPFVGFSSDSKVTHWPTIRWLDWNRTCIRSCNIQNCHCNFYSKASFTCNNLDTFGLLNIIATNVLLIIPNEKNVQSPGNLKLNVMNNCFSFEQSKSIISSFFSTGGNMSSSKLK